MIFKIISFKELSQITWCNLIQRWKFTATVRNAAAKDTVKLKCVGENVQFHFIQKFDCMS